MAEELTLINGNGQPYKLGLPKLIIIGYMNDVALKHITDNTGLVFTPNSWASGYEAQPETALQIAALFMTYNFKTRYYNNWDHANTIILKNDHHVGFDIESVCYDCAVENRIPINGLHPGDRLAC